jgi:hypothetical protein
LQEEVERAHIGADVMQVRHHETVAGVIVLRAGMHQADVKKVHLWVAILLQEEMTEVHLQEEIAEDHPRQIAEAVLQGKEGEVHLPAAEALPLCHVKK